MKEKTSNLAVISNNTFEATKSVKLHHYDISSALQTTLKFDELVAIFSQKVQVLIPHSGFVYSNDIFDLEIQNGMASQHSCSYALTIENQKLGNLTLMRSKRFTKAEIQLLENLLCCLIYPLRNATLFQQTVKLAHTDPLTQTHNRAAFDDTVNREINLALRNSQYLSAIFLDIDHFKAINDQHGHACGDLVLATIAKWIKACARNSDIIFRYGGEEFVILLSNTKLDGAELLAERIRSKIEHNTLAYNMDILKLTVSQGVSTLRVNDTMESFIERADQAMYRAKKNGRNQVNIGN
jgi:diguanylate cyclase (GGDEF)-like protein